MKLTNGQILGLLGSPVFRVEGVLTSIHGRQQSVDVGGKHVVETVPHRLGLGARMSIALMIVSLSKPLEALHRVQQELVKSYTLKAREAREPFASGMSNHDACSTEIQELMAMEVEVGDLPKIKLADLNIDENRIDPRHIVTLMPVLDTTATQP